MSPNNMYLFFLTKPSFNILFIFLIFIIIICMSMNKQMQIYFFIFLQKIILNNKNNMPLSNTLFMMHPMFFFKFWCIIMSNMMLSNFKSANPFIPMMIFFILCLGGFWSLQEFNWGGWWNWDILEMFSVFLMINVILCFHLKKKNMNLKNNFIFFMIINLFMFYYLMNKTGFNSSMHSFMKSSVLSNNIHLMTILFMTNLIFFIFSKKWFFFYFFIFLIFIFFKNFFLIKLVVFFLFFMWQTNILKKKTLNLFMHNTYLLVFLLFILFNFFNNSFSLNTYMFFLKNQMYINFNKTMLSSNHLYFNCQYYYNNMFLFKLVNVFYNKIWLFFLNKFFYHKLTGFTFF